MDLEIEVLEYIASSSNDVGIYHVVRRFGHGDNNPLEAIKNLIAQGYVVESQESSDSMSVYAVTDKGRKKFER